MFATSKQPLLRLRQILGDPHASPPVPPIVPVSRSCWLAGVKAGRFPHPVKIGQRAVAWRSDDIEALMASLKGGAQ